MNEEKDNKQRLDDIDRDLLYIGLVQYGGVILLLIIIAILAGME